MISSNKNFIGKVVQELSLKECYKFVCHHDGIHAPMPSVGILEQIVDDLRAVLFPGYFGYSDMEINSIEHYIGYLLDKVYHRLAKQIKRGFCFVCEEGNEQNCDNLVEKSKIIAQQFIEKLPHIRYLLGTDAQAAYEGDPASKSVGETIFCYPSMRALTNYRIAHELVLLGVPLIPRIIAELAHSETGIDINPGALIGEYFFIDHGTGVVIGETCVIGKNVRLYQGVTLGAKSFPMDEKGNPIKGIPRHPIVEDYVVVYAGATILGRITIGKGAMIGGNVWITSDVAPGTKVLQKRQNNTI
jgi:serine O-acetyltransferase